MTIKTIVTLMIFVGSLLVMSVIDADAARRFGGGRSFGSKPSMNRSTVAPKQQNPAVTQQQGAGAQSAAQAKKPGMLGGMGGMLGGLLAGSLLGSLLFGGAFTGGGMMDILLIALLLFLAFKLFSRRGVRKAEPQPAGGPAQYQQQSMGDRWDHLSQGGGTPSAPAGPVVPAGFNVDEFLEGAKMAYNRLQASWDKRDLEDIALFTSESVQNEVKKQFAEDSEPSKTEILLCNAQLLSVTEENDEQRATVFFDVLLREAPSTDTAQVREVWHFVRSNNGGNWKLDGIQQVEM